MPECTVALAHADTAQHSFLVGTVLSQKLADDVAPEAEAHHDQLGLGVHLLDVANHGCELPSTA